MDHYWDRRGLGTETAVPSLLYQAHIGDVCGATSWLKIVLGFFGHGYKLLHVRQQNDLLKDLTQSNSGLGAGNSTIASSQTNAATNSVPTATDSRVTTRSVTGFQVSGWTVDAIR